jgi:hypothetical protein
MHAWIVFFENTLNTEFFNTFRNGEVWFLGTRIVIFVLKFLSYDNKSF